jgi:hypothetical protein|tara:strand:- start:441 stop:1487 length:1047 start_codon:yes stop_codon:yes gene_type:complete
MAINWTQTGDPSNCEYFSDSNCKTDFKSEVKVQDKRTKSFRPMKSEVVDGATEYIFPEVMNSDTIKVRVQTINDGSGSSDRCEVALSAINMTYVMGLVQQLLTPLPPAEQQALMADSEKLAEKLTPLLLQTPSAVTPQLRTYSINTNNQGIGEKDIFIEDAWPAGPYFLTCHYGYSGLAERTDWDKSAEFLISEIAPLIAGLVIMVISLALGCTIGAALTLGGSCLAVLAISMAVFAAEMGYMAHRILRDGYGAADLNKYECGFPTCGGFFHLYTLDLVEKMESDIMAQVPNNPLFDNPEAAAALSSNPEAQAAITQGEIASESAHSPIPIIVLILIGSFIILRSDDE